MLTAARTAAAGVVLEPLRLDHAAWLVAVLADPQLYAFTGGTPPTRALVDAAERRFAALGASRVDAIVLDGNAAAHALWHGLGYSRQARWSRWVEPL